MTKVNPLLTNKSLIDFVQKLKLGEIIKDKIILAIPELSEEKRLSLLGHLKDIYFVDLKEKEVIQKLEKVWEK